MAATLSQMTKRELKEMIEAAVEATVDKKLSEMLGDPDEGYQIRKAIRDCLRRQRRAVAAGDRGQPLEEVTRRLGLE